MELSAKEKELKALLKPIKDTEDFFWGVYCLVRKQPQLDEMISFLKKNPDADDQTVLVFAFELKETQEIPHGTKEFKEKTHI